MSVAVGDRVKLADALPGGLNQFAGQEGTVLHVLGPLAEAPISVEAVVDQATRLNFGEQYVPEAVAIFVKLDSGTKEAMTDRQVYSLEVPVEVAA